MKNLGQFDPWEHLEDDGFEKIRPPKIKRVKKEQEFVSKKKKRR